MNFTHIQDFPAPLERLWAVFADAGYPEQKYIALGARAVRIRRFHATPRTIEVALERDVTVDASTLPGWARWLTRGEQTLRHHSVWQRIGPAQATAEIDIRPQGLPLHAHGVGTIVEPAPATTRMRLAWSVQSLLGGKVERLFANQIRNALDADHAFTLQYLQRAQEGCDASRASARAMLATT